MLRNTNHRKENWYQLKIRKFVLLPKIDPWDGPQIDPYIFGKKLYLQIFFQGNSSL